MESAAEDADTEEERMSETGGATHVSVGSVVEWDTDPGNGHTQSLNRMAGLEFERWLVDIGIGIEEGAGSEGGWQDGIENEEERRTSVGRIVWWEQDERVERRLDIPREASMEPVVIMDGREGVCEERREQVVDIEGIAAVGELESKARRDKRRKRKQDGFRDKRRRQEF